MPIYSTAGGILMIGAARPGWVATSVDVSQFAGESWVQVRGVTNLGSIGGEWETLRWMVPNPNDPDAPPMPNVRKAVQPDRAMQVAVDLNTADAGQTAMIAAEASINPHAFRVVLSQGAIRMFVALVAGVTDIMDDANRALGLSFSLILQSNLVRA